MCESIWKIHVVAWGTLYARGTAKQAEEWRRHKACWEGCIARKERIKPGDVPEGADIQSLAELLGEEGSDATAG